MSKYDALWVWIKEKGIDGFKLTFAEIQQIAGLPIDHSFLKYKKRIETDHEKQCCKKRQDSEYGALQYC